MRESHRGMVDGCRWRGGGLGYNVAAACMTDSECDEWGQCCHWQPECVCIIECLFCKRACALDPAPAAGGASGAPRRGRPRPASPGDRAAPGVLGPVAGLNAGGERRAPGDRPVPTTLPATQITFKRRKAGVVGLLSRFCK